jgi:hypothetical protein
MSSHEHVEPFGASLLVRLVVHDALLTERVDDAHGDKRSQALSVRRALPHSMTFSPESVRDGSDELALVLREVVQGHDSSAGSHG